MYLHVFLDFFYVLYFSCYSNSTIHWIQWISWKNSQCIIYMCVCNLLWAHFFRLFVILTLGFCVRVIDDCEVKQERNEWLKETDEGLTNLIFLIKGKAYNWIASQLSNWRVFKKINKIDVKGHQSWELWFLINEKHNLWEGCPPPHNF